MNPNFETMNVKELRAYMLAHRDDSEALSVYIRRSKSEGNWSKRMPLLKSIEDLDNYPEFLEKISQDGREKR